jgi:hypothetical protein
VDLAQEWGPVAPWRALFLFLASVLAAAIATYARSEDIRRAALRA